MKKGAPSFKASDAQRRAVPMLAALQPYKYPMLTGDMLFRLWRAAVKDDDTLVEEIIYGMYEAMMAFDRV